MTLKARLEAAERYFDRPVQHTAQGDLYDGIPFVHATAASSDFEPRGRRRRGGEESDFISSARIEMGLVCSYTCGFMAQPPGTRGYGHPFRMVAPVISFAEALETEELRKQDLETLLHRGLMSGIMYLPNPKVQHSRDDEWSSHAVALLLRQSLVTQGLLDKRQKITRLSSDAQRILIAGLIHVVSPNVFNPFDEDLNPPDVSDSWAQAAGLSP
jgi:hypothetical protein